MLPGIAAILAFLLVTKPGIADSMKKVFVAQMCVYTIAFTVSSFGPMYAMDGSFRRITMTLFPAFAIVLGARLGRLLEGSALFARPPLHQA